MITSTSNQRIKRLQQLMDKARVRNREGVFTAEGIRMFLETPAESLTEVYVEEEFWKKISGSYGQEGYISRLAGKIEQCREQGIFTELVSGEVFRRISDTCTPQGILFVARQCTYRLSDLVEKALFNKEQKGRGPLFLLLEDIQDPGNLGTIIRTAEGAGADAVIMSRNTVDIYNPKVIRATMGSLYRVPFLYVDDLPETVRLLAGKGISVYAAHLEADRFYDEIDYGDGCAFLIGNEGNGLSREITECARNMVKIPMEGKLESLNAAVSAALLMYQAAGCHRKKSGKEGEKTV